MQSSNHHAQLFWGNDLAVIGVELAELKTEFEVTLFTSASLTISLVRDIIRQAQQRPIEKQQKLIILQVASIATEAQHALLKILEEPPVTTRFILVVHPQARLLPTILSRCQVKTVSSATSDELPAECFVEFLHSDIPKRMANIAEKAKQKDDIWFASMLEGLLVWLQTPPIKQVVPIAKCATYLRQRGVAKKMVWEELALTLPIEVGA